MNKTYHHLGIHVTEDIPGVDWIDLGDVKLNNPSHHPQRARVDLSQARNLRPGCALQAPYLLHGR